MFKVHISMFKENYILLPHNTFGIDAKCRQFVEYNTVEEAQEIALQLQQPYLLVPNVSVVSAKG